MGSGGGGKSDLLAELAREYLSRTGPITVYDPCDLDPEALCLPVGHVGSSTRRSERLPAGDELPRLFAAAEHEHRRPVDAVAWIEAAGSNFFVPIVAAALTGARLVDADGMGRAFSKITQTSYQVRGVPPSPVILVGNSDETIVIRAPADQLEPLVRPALEALGGWGMGGWYAQTNSCLAQSAIHGTLQRLYRQGRSLREQGMPADGKLIASGRVLTVEEVGGGTRSIVITSEDERVLRLLARNEYVLALLDGRPVAAVPDILVPIGHELRMPINVEDLYTGQDVDVWQVPAPTIWRERVAAKTVDLRAHGIEVGHDGASAHPH